VVHAPKRTINRYYEPATGQFVSVDPMVNETGQPYLYAGDDPVNGTDPSGLDPTEILYEQGSLFADSAAANPGYFNYGSFNDLSTLLVNAINAPFVGVYDAYDSLYQAGKDGCSLTTAIALTGDAVTADISAALFLTGDPEGEALDAGGGYVNLASESATNHVLEGDGLDSGGHLWPGAAGKTPFPASWSAGKIMNEISNIATDPAAWETAETQGSRTLLTGVEDGVEIRVVVNTSTGEIVTGYPANLPRNP
jgi:uncharacterized protein RhaS with RHS repeats